MKYFVLDENKNKVEAYDKEGVIALLEKAIADGSLEGLEEDTAFVSKIKSLTNGGTYHVDFVTQAKYNELEASGALVANCYYFITDDEGYDDIYALFERIRTGEAVVGRAKYALTASQAESTPFSSTDTSVELSLADGVLTGKASLTGGSLYWGEVVYKNSNGESHSVSLGTFRFGNHLHFSQVEMADTANGVLGFANVYIDLGGGIDLYWTRMKDGVLKRGTYESATAYFKEIK